MKISGKRNNYFIRYFQKVKNPALPLLAYMIFNVPCYSSNFKSCKPSSRPVCAYCTVLASNTSDI